MEYMRKTIALAVDGGPAVRKEFLPFGAPCLGEEEYSEVLDTLRSGWIGTGPKCARFEREFAEYVGARHAVAVNSCTAGLFLSLLACEVGAGDEVITSPLTFAATANVIIHTGARPVFADIDPTTLNIDPDEVRRLITPRTKAIVPVHFGGLPCAMDELAEIARMRNVPIIEDAAHAVGSRYHGRLIGGLGHVTSFSFYANKNLTTAEGGMITFDNDTLLEPLQVLRLHGLDRDAWKRYSTRRLMLSEVILPGYKLNLTDLAASIGIHQLAKQERFLKVREHYAALYDDAFAGMKGVRLQPRPKGPDDRHALHLYVLILDPGCFSVGRDAIADALLAEGIGAALHYRALHTHPYYVKTYGYRPQDYPHAAEIGDSVFSLPLSPKMSESDVGDVIRAVHKVLYEYAL
jgi:dTDP-4-amino-4,6-dideoxygalactose transaminase